MAVAGRTSADAPSPQLTDNDEIAPSASPAWKVRFTIWPVFTGLVELETVMVGGLSFTVSVVVPEPGPAAFVAVTVIVNVSDFAFPVEA